MAHLPDFDSLPPVEGMPQGCAWGIFDKAGEKDFLGTLNILTPSIVASACKEARDGISISLNWPLNANIVPFGRNPPIHSITALTDSGLSNGSGWDDSLTFNTQASSQWDSLVHWAHQPSRLAYNGIRATHSLLSTPTSSAENTMPTLDHWHAAGGLVTRGVLIDIKAWYEANAAKQGKSGDDAVFHPLEEHRITVRDIENCAKHEGVEFRPGDVLIVRTGMTEVLEAPEAADLAKMQKAQLAGVHGDISTARWLWNKHFAAVAGDSIAFEALMPLKEDGSLGAPEDLVLHPWLLSMFGMPIGELWDLKALSKHCRESGRYTFLLTSAPLNVPGLVGSPPNALAIF
ncbi:hypothetical protein BU23DRAFT_482423 [Bimuria novae-zelandiae CBS 107.79]|uniref:Cyclase n=1 Tax=Bimuria novae-zelandiae CBS 107.79 TaxID=1447943 RepID=A0A6A5US29_9PLEO|nr:hypothetical protein BU23DRAFT_482423 [Bimuria novae-zelandiae CBS 107.79]